MKMFGGITMTRCNQLKRKIKAVILAPIRDFGRCKLASHMCAALCAVAAKPVLTRLLSTLAVQGIDRAVICYYGDNQRLKDAVKDVKGMEIEFLDEPLPVGSAGCIRDASCGDRNTLLLVLYAGIISPPKVSTLIEAHQESKSHLTVFFASGPQSSRPEDHALEIYICDRRVVDYMPSQGYFDIKEGLIPEMVRFGQTVAAKVLPLHATGFRDRRSCLSALTHYLHSGVDINEDLSLGLIRRSKDLWTAENAQLAADVTIHGPVVVMERVRIASGAVIFGPTIIEPDVTIGENSLIDNTVVWARANIASNCRIHRSIIHHGATVRPNSVVNDNVVLCQNTAEFGPWTNLIGDAASSFQPHIAIPE